MLDTDNSDEAISEARAVLLKYQQLRDQVKSRVREAAERRKQSRLQSLDQQEDKLLSDELAQVSSNSTFSETQSSRLKEKLKARAKARRSKRKQLLEVELDVQERLTEQEIEGVINMRQQSEVQKAAARGLEMAAVKYGQEDAIGLVEDFRNKQLAAQEKLRHHATDANAAIQKRLAALKRRRKKQATEASLEMLSASSSHVCKY